MYHLPVRLANRDVLRVGIIFDWELPVAAKKALGGADAGRRLDTRSIYP